MSSCSMVSDNIARCPVPAAMDDDLLVEAAQAGQEWAFVELCSRYSKRVFNTIYGVTKNREDAEDALQDSMMRAFLHLQQFDRRSSFATWFTRIGINSALMILRKKRIRLETSMDATAEGEGWQTWQIADHSADPEKHYVGYERSQHLRRAICHLPNALRSVVERGQLEGHSMKQIARNMGISIPATKSRLARAKVALRKSMVSSQPQRAAVAAN
ncbi:MAG TPA: sigma-70 family RNA polymerase sigma factor [Acidobacteriaceae bacterium]|nr:sigma-70 family RNA polymerase sigma factor [Acidobacteriaceae bacterium]